MTLVVRKDSRQCMRKKPSRASAKKLHCSGRVPVARPTCRLVASPFQLHTDQKPPSCASPAPICIDHFSSFVYCRCPLFGLHSLLEAHLAGIYNPYTYAPCIDPPELSENDPSFLKQENSEQFGPGYTTSHTTLQTRYYQPRISRLSSAGQKQLHGRLSDKGSLDLRTNRTAII